MLRSTLLLLLIGGTLQAATWDDLKLDCSMLKDNYKSCASDLFTARPVHIIVKSVVPGSGYAIGAAASQDFNRGQWQRKVDASAAISLRQFWTAGLSMSASHPKFGASNSARDNFTLNLYSNTKSLPTMPYFGIGPNTTRANQIDYSERYTVAGADVFNPLSKWFAVGVRTEGIFAEASLLPNPLGDSPGQAVVRATVPGVPVNTQKFFRAGGFLELRAPGGRFDFDSKASYDNYHAFEQNQYSFGRFRGELTEKIFPFGTTQFRRDRIITLHGVYSTTVADSSKTVPFYMQETIGGSTIDNDYTLRGFRDYRFRAPHLMYTQVQYDHRIWEPLGVFVFYDAGTVATSRGDLTLSNLHHNYGFGINLFLAQNVWFRAAIAFGSGEGYHPYFQIPKF